MATNKSKVGAPKASIATAISEFGAEAAKKLHNAAVTGAPEDQIRAPFEQLLKQISSVIGFADGTVIAVGESSISDLKTRPDYAVTVNGALVGFIELKAPGKGADPRKYKDPHDKAQWEKLESLPNILYSDGEGFSLFQNGELFDSVLRLNGSIEADGGGLSAPPGLQLLFEQFLRWEPIPPSSAKELAHVCARLCRLLRDEVTEQLGKKNAALTHLAEDWRKLLFPDASDERFADGYAQAVTFGLLMARAKKIKLANGLQQVAAALSKTNSLIGAALNLLTHNAENQETLKTSLGTLTRVLDAVDWVKISKGKSDAWLYFYEDFLAVYDNELRKQTGSYYTPPEVVSAMVGLVDEALKSSRFGLHNGMAAPQVTLADPATGTGTFVLGVLRRIAENISSDEGPGAVKAAISAAVKRLIAFEMQLGPFAVAQLRILAEIVDLTDGESSATPRMFVTDTLANPYEEQEWLPEMLAAIGNSRREANRIKREETITVVLGNPPYKEKAKGKGGWIEGETKDDEESAPLADWMPPREWGVGVHAKHLRNLYVYFWRWATWKVFDHGPGSRTGVVCFITVAGFLDGPGFQGMRDYLRRKCDEIWVIDCSPEGHQPDVSSRIFQGVQQPICIVLASRSGGKAEDEPARVQFKALPEGHRNEKFEALSAIRLDSGKWSECSTDWRAPFRTASNDLWASYPALEDYFGYNGSGVMPGRTWVIAPDASSLVNRWKALTNAPEEQKELLFHPHLRGGKPGDRHSKKIIKKGLHGILHRDLPVAADHDPVVTPIPYGFRSFDRQFIIPDVRLINQPNPSLWKTLSKKQVFLTALERPSPTSGPAVSMTANIPDLHHYKGSFGGRVFPLYVDASGTNPNILPGVIEFLSKRWKVKIEAADVLAYIAGIAAHPAYTLKFGNNLSTPGLRIPLTGEKNLFMKAVEIGRTVVWLHTFGERFADPTKGKPSKPRLPKERTPVMPKDGAISEKPGEMPDTIKYDGAKKRLLIGKGFIDNVDPKAWAYEVSGKQVLLQWFSYRKADRDRPIMGDRRPPSPLCQIQPDHWLPEYTTDLLNVLHVLTMLTELESEQAALLDAICAGPVISVEDLKKAGALEKPAAKKAADEDDQQGLLIGL